MCHYPAMLAGIVSMRKEVGYFGFMGGPRSMGRVGHRFLMHLLRKSAYQAYFMPYGNDFMQGQWEPAVRSCILEPPDRELEEVVHFCSVLEAGRVRNASKSISWLFYELSTVPPKVVEAINTNDLVLVTSGFVGRVFREAGVTVPIRAMGHGYDPSVYVYRRRELEGRFEFLCVAEHTPRKNLPMLIRCFEQAFQGRQDVRLTLKLATHGEKDIRSYIRDSGMIRIRTDNVVDESKMAALYHEAHCFVLPTRGEGFGMPILEGMATGLPMIVTGFGGHLDFTNEATAGLIRNRGLVDSDPECFPFVQSQWADPDPAHLVELLRGVVKDYSAAQDKAEAAYRNIKEEWTWEAQLDREYP